MKRIDYAKKILENKETPDRGEGKLLIAGTALVAVVLIALVIIN